MGDARLEQWLDALDRCRTSQATNPPDRFISAVGRRRRNRRIASAARAGSVVAAVALFAAMLTTGHPIRPHAPAGSLRPLPDGAAATPDIPESSMIALTRANPTLDADHLVLPDPAPSAPASPDKQGWRRTIPLSGMWTPDEVERWLAGN